MFQLELDFVRLEKEGYLIWVVLGLHKNCHIKIHYIAFLRYCEQPCDFTQLFRSNKLAI
jgi:hypothetical protein